MARVFDLLNTTDDAAAMLNEKPSEFGTWMPYQEYHLPPNSSSIATRSASGHPSTSNTLMHLGATGENLDGFGYATPTEILQYMIESVEKYHGDAYGQHCRRLRHSGDEFLELLLPQARQVLLSRDYSRTKFIEPSSSAIERLN